MSEEGKNYWKNRYPCGKNGGWIRYRIKNKRQLKDIGIFLSIRTNKEIEIKKRLNIKVAKTSHNRSVCASPQKRLGVQSPRSFRYAHSHGSFTHIWAGGLCFAKPLYACPNVAYSRNVMCNTP